MRHESSEVGNDSGELQQEECKDPPMVFTHTQIDQMLYIGLKIDVSSYHLASIGWNRSARWSGLYKPSPSAKKSLPVNEKIASHQLGYTRMPMK